MREKAVQKSYQIVVQISFLFLYLPLLGTITSRINPLQNPIFNFNKNKCSLLKFVNHGRYTLILVCA